MISINPKKAGIILFFVVILPSFVGFFYFTRFNYIPIGLTVGQCMMDYTSPVTYQERLSGLESEGFTLKGWDILICYGSPSLRNRDMLGNRIPYDELWRFGANEPTRFYTTADVNLGGLFVPKGRYSIYAKPGRFEWEIFINESTAHWGNDFSTDITAREIGSFMVKPEYIREAVETFAITSEIPELGSGETELIVEWEHTRLRIPIQNLETEDKTDYSLKNQIRQKSQEREALEAQTLQNN